LKSHVLSSLQYTVASLFHLCLFSTIPSRSEICTGNGLENNRNLIGRRNDYDANVDCEPDFTYSEELTLFLPMHSNRKPWCDAGRCNSWCDAGRCNSFTRILAITSVACLVLETMTVQPPRRDHAVLLTNDVRASMRYIALPLRQVKFVKTFDARRPTNP
jgi:hypothetical protein